jgi:Ca2+-binding EF-hand superfamily protein
MSSLHQTYSRNEDGKMQKDITVPLDMCSTSSESESTEDEEERLKQLFSSCDRDGDGFIDR